MPAIAALEPDAEVAHNQLMNVLRTVIEGDAPKCDPAMVIQLVPDRTDLHRYGVTYHEIFDALDATTEQRQKALSWSGFDPELDLNP